MYLPDLKQPSGPIDASATGTILLVDDNDAFRGVISTFLQGAGYRVLEARTASEASTIATHQEKPVDLLLTDVVLPGVNGDQLGDYLSFLFPKNHGRLHVRLRQRRQLRQRRFASRRAHAAETVFKAHIASRGRPTPALERTRHPEVRPHSRLGRLFKLSAVTRLARRPDPHSTVAAADLLRVYFSFANSRSRIRPVDTFIPTTFFFPSL